MKTFLTTTLAALAIAGAALTAAPTPAKAAVDFVIGPNGAHVGFSNGYYYDRHHRRHMYRYPRDWRSYNRPRSWYRENPNWHREPNWWR